MAKKKYKKTQKKVDLNPEDIEFLETIEKKNIEYSNTLLDYIFSEAKKIDPSEIPANMKRPFLNAALFKALRAINFPYELLDETAHEQADQYFNEYSQLANTYRVKIMAFCEDMHHWKPKE